MNQKERCFFRIDKKYSSEKDANTNEIKKCAVLIDFEIKPYSKWNFIDGLVAETQEEWIVLGKESNKDHGSIRKNLKRYIKYFSFSTEILKKKTEFKAILAWQQFYGIILVWIARLLRIKDLPDVFILTFIYKEKKGLLGTLYRRFIKYALCSDYISKVFVFSKSEQLYYSKLFNKTDGFFVPLTLGIEDVANQFSVENGKYYVSAGRSNRDYAFLRKNWPRSRRLIIISDVVQKVEDDGICYETRCYGKDYLEKVAHCHAVVVPLEDNNISSGQLVVLQAFMFGKPVVATTNDTISEYIEDGRSGFVIDKSFENLNYALESIDVNYTSFSMCARKAFEERFSLLAMGRNIGRIINDELRNK